MEIFGSSVRGTFDPDTSDFDFLVQFNHSEKYDRFDQYMNLLLALEQQLGRKVDLVCDRAIRNPYFREAVDETKVLLYAA